MRYYLDTEFDGHGGPPISLALVREDGESIYLVYQRTATDPWVQDNVIPILWDMPEKFEGRSIQCLPHWVSAARGAQFIADFLQGDDYPFILADWPDDIAYLCRALITGPGQMVETQPTLAFCVRRVDAYPTTLPGAVRHNAWWDAMALRNALEMPPVGVA